MDKFKVKSNNLLCKFKDKQRTEKIAIR